MTKTETIVLDVRTVEEIAASGKVHHANWFQTSNDDLTAHPETVVSDKTATIVVYCRSGRRSSIAQTILQDAGYTGPILNAGGYEDIKDLQ